MSLFFLIVYDAALGGIGTLSAFGGSTYLAYLLPMGIVSIVFGSSAGSAQSVSRDIASGYFFRLALAPVSRASFVLAAVLADAVGLFVSSLAVIGVGLLLGSPVAGGLPGAAASALLATLFGAGISAVSAATVMRTGKVELATTIGSLVFTLLFLAPTFAPRELMGAAWLRTVSVYNPLTYLMEAMRFLVSGVGSPDALPIAWTIAAVLGIGGAAAAARTVRNVLN
jgi:ABC-2 type transport system permease protein